ncbi:D-alanyl-D-alanine carboxypeptidase [Streptomyces qaidamensis]|uniref:serine-type D-Ala-D-Ala carboxypeptidase n=1 Tax=Streptomyces qaidamensis TaxID=1783515 RepID=A0A143C0S0_9ACTN|nr:D-alanyl-D-alanine carboxypeptidase [Streptomyces qaidamensis]AMW11096.1 D-alanyl-D-alanine carboxypeptidase [Streptomyces qaidamensis]
MAGESPDRSKQRESSARETSGSASPVPEARSEVADPRLAVARDPERSAARGGADTATRVLSTRTAEEPESTGRAAGGSDTEDDAERIDGDSGPEAAESDSDAEDAAADAGQDTSGSSEGSKGSKGSEGSEGTDGRLRDAVAAWVASADEGEPAAAEGAEKGGKADADADAEDDRADGPAEAGTDEAEPERANEPAEAGTDAEGAQEAAETASEGSGAAHDDADEPEADRSAGVEADAEDTAEAKTEAEVEADERTDAEDSEPSEPAADNDVKGSKATDTEDDATGSDATGSDSTDDAAENKPGKADHVTGESDDDTDGSPAAPPVDQPTAVFKVVRPPVDQPTTMLKLGGAARDLPKTDLPKTDVPKKDVPEKDAERTSKFVALKPLDDPSARKPAAPASAPASAPAVAPADATAPVPTVGPERTTQQPLPPRPPLDLLAELTNTPPPPETPLRTAARRVKIWTPLVLLLVVVFAVVQSVRPLPSPTLELTAEDSYTFEGGKVDIPWPTKGQAALDVQGIGTFGSSGEQKPVPIASVAKVMTAYVILRDHPLKSGADGPKILIDQAAQDQSDAGQESTVDVTKDDRITEREALESILIASANNVARLLARWDAGSEKAFVRKMNQAAVDLGMKNTTYTDPSGLNNTTVSTAVDQVKLAKAAMQQPVFREVAAMMSYVDYKQKKHDNWNRLVGYNDVTGIKTGTTTSALGNLVFAAKKDVNGETRRIIGAVVRQPAGGPDNTILGAALHEGDKLIRAAQGALESATILKKGDVVGYADDGLGGRTPVAVTKDVTAVGWAGLSVKLTFAADDLPHTAKAGAKVGTLTVGDGTTSAVKVPVALQKDLVEPGFAAKLTRLG